MTETVEEEIQRKGLTAPRVTPADLEAEIAKDEFTVFTGSCLTVCVLTLRNGFTVTGESACASPDNFDAEIGRRIARDNAKQKLWPLLGFRLKDKLARTPDEPRERVLLELNDLSLKVQALERFIGTSPFLGLTDVAQDLLKEQLGYMKAYHQTLVARLEQWTP